MRIYNPEKIQPPQTKAELAEAALSRLPAGTTAGVREAIGGSLAAILEAAEIEESSKTLKICRN